MLRYGIETHNMHTHLPELNYLPDRCVITYKHTTIPSSSRNGCPLVLWWRKKAGGPFRVAGGPFRVESPETFRAAISGDIILFFNLQNEGVSSHEISRLF